MPTAYAYIRYSSKAQGGAGRDSVDRQMASIRSVVKSRNLYLPDENIFSDTGISAFTGVNKTKGKLKDLIDMINDLRVKPGDYIFVESIDRLSRQRLLQAKELVNSILEKGIVLVTTLDGQRYEKPSNENGIDDLQQDILLSVIAKRAYEESKTKSVRRKSAWDRAKKQAEEQHQIFNSHNPPYGIAFDKGKNKFVIVEEEAKEIRDIFENLKYMGVALSIKKVNLYSKRRWTNKTVQTLLDTKYVVGSYMSQRRDENRKKVFERYIENYYPAIITHQQYNEAIDAMRRRADRKNYGNQSIGSLNIFRHCIKCDSCHASLIFEKQRNPKGIVYPYFHCHTKKELGHGCEAPRFRFDLAFGLLLQLVFKSTTKEDYTPHAFETAIEDYDYKDSFIETESGLRYRVASEEEMDEQDVFLEKLESFRHLLIDLLNSKSSIKSDNEKEINLEKEISKNRFYKQNLMRSFEAFDDGIIPPEFIRKIRDTDEKIKSLEAEILKLKSNINLKRTAIDIYNEQDVIKLYRTEEGRLKLNNFFVVHDIKFYFAFDTHARLLRCRVFKDEMEIDRVAATFKLHKPLEKYGILNLNEYFN